MRNEKNDPGTAVSGLSKVENTQIQKHRILALYRMLLCGRPLIKKELAVQYGVSEKSVQRDIECLRNFIAETEPEDTCLRYDRRENRYILTSPESETGRALACEIAAVLRDTPSLSPDRRAAMFDWLLGHLSVAERYTAWKTMKQGER